VNTIDQKTCSTAKVKLTICP